MAGSWRGKNILKRNALIALANMEKEENLELILQFLEDENPMIREYAQWAKKNIFFQDYPRNKIGYAIILLEKIREVLLCLRFMN